MKSLKDEIEQIMEKVHYAKLFDTWVQNFAINLNNIWNESSARELTPNQNNMNKNEYLYPLGPPGEPAEINMPQIETLGLNWNFNNVLINEIL